MNIDIFQIFIKHMQRYSKNKKMVMVLDNASWHITSKINWGRIKPFFLPPIRLKEFG